MKIDDFNCDEEFKDISGVVEGADLEEHRVKKNFWPFVLEGSLFQGGTNFMNASTVIPLFVAAFGGSAMYLSIIQMIRNFGSNIAELIQGPYSDFIKNQKRFITLLMLFMRPMPLVVMPVVLLTGMPDWVVLAAFMFSYSCVWICNGTILTPWTDLFARTTNTQDRGKVYGNQLIIGSVVGVLCGYIVSACMNNEAVTSRQLYALLFGIAGFLLLFSVLFMAVLKDIPYKVKKRDCGFFAVLGKYYGGLFHYWRANASFRKLFFANAMCSISLLITPYVIGMGEEIYSLTEGQLALMTTMNIVGGIVSGFLWKYLSLLVGNRGVIFWSSLLSLSIPVLLGVALLVPQSAFILFCVIFFIMGNTASGWVGYSNYLLEIVSKEDRSSYIVFMTLLKAPFSLLYLVAGAIITAFGYLPLVIVTAVASITGCIIALILPRVGMADKSVSMKERFGK